MKPIIKAEEKEGFLIDNTLETIPPHPKRTAKEKKEAKRTKITLIKLFIIKLSKKHYPNRLECK
jgi:hypothetical protein